jgi:Fe-S-cluster containining protein
METVTRSEDCVVCKECCKFHKDKLYFAPLFTDDELDALKKARPTDEPPAGFHRFHGSRTVWQIELLPSATSPSLWVCPFLDEATNMCAIYPDVPFDCRVWPFLVAWSADGQGIELACYERKVCASLRNTGSDEFAAYTTYILGYVRRPQFLRHLREHMELIWPHQPGTIPLADLTADVLPARVRTAETTAHLRAG